MRRQWRSCAGADAISGRSSCSGPRLSQTNSSWRLRSAMTAASSSGVSCWRNNRRRKMKIIRLVTVILTITAAADTQTSRGTVSGTVTDPSGAVVTDASVALTHTETGVRRTTATNEAGIYRVDAVDLGRYELKVTHPGFNVFVA